MTHKEHTVEEDTIEGEVDGHMVKFISGKTHKILMVDEHKFYKSTCSKSTAFWNCRLLRSLG